MGVVVDLGYGNYVSIREFQTIVNEKLIEMGLPESRLIDEKIAKEYIDLHYSVEMAIDGIFVLD